MAAPFILLVAIFALLVLIPSLDSNPAFKVVVLWVWTFSLLLAMWLWITTSGSRCRG